MPLKVLAQGTVDGAKPAIDIVAVHGLNPWNKKDHAYDTWRKPEGEKGHLWLRDTFPHAQPDARVLLYSYNSAPAFGESKEKFIHEANSLLERLSLTRREDPRRPLILIGHSLGGILIKQALVNAQANPDYKDIKDATCGLMFFGTPHAGPTEDLKVRFAKVCVAIIQAMPGHPSSDLMEALRKGSLFSDLLQENWRHQLEKYHIVSFYEGKGNLVPRDSAAMGLPGHREKIIKLEASHSDMCRFDLPNSLNEDDDRDNYELVEGNLTRLCALASKSLQQKSEELLLQDLVESLSLPETATRSSKIPDAHSKTFEWIWDTNNDKTGFVKWLEGQSCFFWINGKTGSGKSTLMKYLTGNGRTHQLLRGKRTGMHPLIIPWFFSDQGTNEEKSFSAFLRHTLHEILIYNGSLRSILHPVFEKIRARSAVLLEGRDWKRMASYTWNHDELEGALISLAEQCAIPTNICIFVDALEESIGKPEPKLDFLFRLVDATQNKPMRVKFCLSSRPLNAIQLRLKKHPKLELQQWTNDDISTYVFDRLTETTELVNDNIPAEEQIGPNLIPEIVERASGVFAWVKLVVDEISTGLEQGDNSDELFQRLSELPLDLEQLYSTTLESIPSSYLHDTCNYFSLILTWPGLPTLIEFALAAHPEENLTSEGFSSWPDIHISRQKTICDKMRRRLQSRCKGLLDLVPGNTQDASNGGEGLLPYRRLSFLHGTTKDYISRQDVMCKMKARAKKQELKDPNVALLLYWFYTMEKDTYLYKPGTGAKSWQTMLWFMWHGWHAEVATKQPQVQLLDDLDRIWSNQHPGWTDQLLQKYAPAFGRFGFPSGSSIYSLAVASGLILYVQEKIESGFIDGPCARSLLPFAMTAKHNDGRKTVAPNMISLLLTHESLNHRLPRETTLWNYALQQNLTNIDAVIQCMVDHGADPNQLTRFEKYSGTPLHFMLYNFSGNTEKLLGLVHEWLDIGADLDRLDSNGETVVDLILRNHPRLRLLNSKETTLLMDRRHRITEVPGGGSNTIQGSNSTPMKRRYGTIDDLDGDYDSAQGYSISPRRRQPQIVDLMDED